MELAVAIRSVISTFRRRPSDLLPFYMLGLAIPALAQVLTVIGIGILIVYYVGTSRFTVFREELGALDDPPDPNDDPDAFIEWAEQLEPVVEPLITLPALSIVVLTITLVLLSMFLLTAAVNAGQLSTCFGRLRGERGVVAGIDGFSRFWRRMVGLYLFEAVLWILLTVVAIGAVVLAALVSIVLAIFVGIFAGLAWIAGAIAIRGIFVFAPVALIVDDRSITGSVRASAQFIRADFMSAVSYYAVAIGVLIAFSGLAGTFTAIGAPALASLGSFLIIAPALDLLKTALFGDYRDAIDPRPGPEVGLVSQVRTGLRHGLGETAKFVRETPLLHAGSVVVMVIGFVVGWIAVGPLVGEVPFPSIGDRLELLFAPAAGLYFFSNNWSVAISVAFAGAALSIPAILILWINGFSFGATARLEPDQVELLYFVIPHGIIEIPAILIAGALGIYLGIAVWRRWRGSSGREELADALHRGYWVLIGVGILLAVAGFIEGYFSPYYYQLII